MNMIILYNEDQGAVFTLDEETKELYYAPVYQDDTVNLSEFHPVDYICEDEEDDLFSIHQELIAMYESSFVS